MREAQIKNKGQSAVLTERTSMSPYLDFKHRVGLRSAGIPGSCGNGREGRGSAFPARRRAGMPPAGRVAEFPCQGQNARRQGQGGLPGRFDHRAGRLEAENAGLFPENLSGRNILRDQRGHRRDRLGPRRLPAQARCSGQQARPPLRRVRHQRPRRSAPTDSEVHRGHRPPDVEVAPPLRHLFRVHARRRSRRADA